MTADSRTAFTRECVLCHRVCQAEDFYQGGYSVCRECCLAAWGAASGPGDDER